MRQATEDRTRRGRWVAGCGQFASLGCRFVSMLLSAASNPVERLVLTEHRVVFRAHAVG
jgi:hypothetical protein